MGRSNLPERLAATYGHLADFRAREDAVRIIDAWNARLASNRPVFFSPTIGAALVAGRPWLTVYCPGCRTVATIDLRMKPRPPQTTINEILPKLKCRFRCHGMAAVPWPRHLGIN